MRAAFKTKCKLSAVCLRCCAGPLLHGYSRAVGAVSVCAHASSGDEALGRRQGTRLDVEKLADQQVMRCVVRLHLQGHCPCTVSCHT